MSAARVVVSLPASAKKGELVEVKTLAGHPMETGFRRTQTGVLIPRDIITAFSCRYNGEEVFSAELHPAVAANPLVAFTFRAAESGTLECRWSGDNGFTASHSARLDVV